MDQIVLYLIDGSAKMIGAGSGVRQTMAGKPTEGIHFSGLAQPYYNVPHGFNYMK